MFSLYLICSLVGGGLVALTLFGGGDDASADTGGELEVGGSGGKLGELVLARAGRGTRWWAPLSTFRFWVFFSAFFGWTGLALHWLTNLEAATITTLSAAMGAVAAVMMAFSMSFVRRSESDSSVHLRDLPGSEAVVLLPITPTRPGKVRVSFGNRELEFIALPDGEAEIARGQRVIILNEEDGRVRVTPSETFLPDRWPDASAPQQAGVPDATTAAAEAPAEAAALESAAAPIEEPHESRR